MISKKIILFSFLILFSFSGILMAQERNISGTVTGEDDELPIAGVNVVIKGTNQGAVTNMYGQYSIDVESEDDVLVFVFLKYKTTKIKVDDQNKINVKMEVEDQPLEEIVKIGYNETGQKTL